MDIVVDGCWKVQPKCNNTFIYTANNKITPLNILKGNSFATSSQELLCWGQDRKFWRNTRFLVNNKVKIMKK